jgi:trehalose 6-phosphate synthase/phosphatase
VLSEFTGAADELGGALLINPHDVDGIKDAIERAVSMSQRESRSRMRRLRRRVLHDDVARWSQRFLTALREIEPRTPVVATADEPLDTALARLAADADNGEELLIALDFDGVLSPLVDVPSAARATPRGVEALQRLSVIEHVHLALISGRGLQDLSEVAEVPPGTFLVGSHGAEPGHWDGALHNDPVKLDETQRDLYLKLGDELEAAIAGTTARIELKPTTVVLHTRGATPEDTDRLTEAAVRLGEQDGVDAMRGRDVVELSVLSVTKGDALTALRAQTHAHRVLFAGDDVTDERAMRTLASGDVGIRVGDGYTVAAHRVADPEAMADVLHRLADFLERD